MVGLKPGRGLVSLTGVHPLSPALDTVGALARDVATAARVLAVISGPDGKAATRGPFDAEAALAMGVAGRRLAAIPLDALGEIHPEIGRLYLEALERLRAAGLVVETIEPPQTLDQSFTPNGMLMAGEGWRIWRDRIRKHAQVMDPWIVRRFEAGREISDERLAEAHLRRAADQASFHAWLAGYDALLCPTCPIPAPPLDTVDETVSPLSRLTRAANYLDLARDQRSMRTDRCWPARRPADSRTPPRRDLGGRHRRGFRKGLGVEWPLAGPRGIRRLGAAGWGVQRAQRDPGEQ